MQTKTFDWDDMNCFLLDVSMWSGRSKMTRDDLKDPDAVPPDALASLGSLKLIDPDRLKIFNAIKRRALRLLESHGVAFLNGYVVAEDMVDTIDAELVKLKDEYNMSVVKLVTDYADQCEDWLQKNAQWAHVLRPRLPSSGDIMQKFNFDWTLFKVKPASSRTAHQGTVALEDAKDGLGNTAVVEVSKMLGECARNLLRDGRETYNDNAFSSVNKAIAKCDELSFINPELGVLSSLIKNVKSGVLGGSLPNDTFRVIFAALSSPASINNVLELSKAGVSVEDMGWALQPSVQQNVESCGGEDGLDGGDNEDTPFDFEAFNEQLTELGAPEELQIKHTIESDSVVDGVSSGEAWQATVQGILKDLPTPSALNVVKPEPAPEPISEDFETPEDSVQDAEPVEFAGLMNLEGII